ncbi:MAG: protein kinase [Acidimicrobiales bacterium]|nr:protein kinase [Acidimicrobiales bacterium]
MALSRTSDQIGRVLDGRYRLVAPIGTGASAMVYLADDVRLRRRVAVKVLHPNLAADEQFLRRFQAEAQAAAALNDPHIMAVYDWGRDEVPYLVTEYLGGGSLRGVLDHGDRLTLSQALLVGLQATRGLEYAHGRGIIHRDIKPANLLFGDDERLRIGDFGLARALAEAGWTEPSGTVLGTVRYASPEQAKGEHVEPRSDVYSLGLTLIEAVSGTVPFAADTPIATLMARIDTPVELDRDLFGPLRPVLERACRPDAADRPDAGELAISFMAAAESLPRPTPLVLPGAATPVGDDAEPQPDLTNIAPDDAEPVVVPGPDAIDGAGDGAAPPSKRQARRAQRRQARDERRAARTRRRRWPWVAAALVVVAVAAAGTVFATTALQTPTHEVEDYSGLFESDVRNLVSDYGWEVQVEDWRETGSSVGEVVRQEPAAGTELEEGADSVLTIYVSRGNALADLPPGLPELPRDEAVRRIEEADLVVGEERPEHHEEIPEGHVIRTSHEEPLAELDPVDLVISSGPAPRELPPVPVETTYDEMAALLDEDGLVPERGESSSETIPEGFVIALEPVSGELVPRGSTVRVIVSTGLPMVEVPDVSGLTESEAIAEIRDHGLSVGSRIGPPRNIRSTDPAAGTTVRQGTEVDLLTR